MNDYEEPELTKEEKDKIIEKDIEEAIEERLESRFGGGCCGGGDDSWWEERRLIVKIVLGVGMGILGVGLGALCILVVMLLWNWLMPLIFGLTTLTYWQSGGLMLLSWILFKNIRIGDEGSKTERRRKRELKRHMEEE